MPLDVSSRRAAFDVYHAYVGDSDEDTQNVSSPSAAKGSGLLDNTKEFDPVTFDALMVDPEVFAQQITIMDLPVFQAIQPEELVECGWTKKNKQELSPNVCAFTRRFNHLVLWCEREVVSRHKPKQRAEVLTHFIRIARRLYDIGNLHSAMAIVSGLQSTAIHRLRFTWPHVPTKERALFDKLNKLFSEDHNFERLRAYMDSAKLPCIPHLGFYLRDLIHIDVAHPPSSTLDRDARSTQMNNLLRMLAEFQRSEYPDFQPIDCVQSFLDSIRFIDELQKFEEDACYRESCAREPDEKTLNLTASASGAILHDKLIRSESMARRESFPVMNTINNKAKLSVMQDENDSTLKLTHLREVSEKHNVSVMPKNKRTAYVRAHRKAQSLGNPSQFRFMHEPGKEKIDGWPQHQIRHLLDDSLIVDQYECNKTAPPMVLNFSKTMNDSSTRDSGLDTCDGSPSTTKTNSMQSHRSVTIGPVTDITELVSPCSPGCSRSMGRNAKSCPMTGNDNPAACTSSSADRCATKSSPSVRFDLPNRDVPMDDYSFEGALRRKTVMRAGDRPLMQPWTRYWCALSDTYLLYFASKPLPSRNMEARSAYKMRPYKSHDVSGWTIARSTDPSCPDLLTLTNMRTSSVYHFRCGSQSMAIRWSNALKDASRKNRPSPPENLIAFE